MDLFNSIVNSMHNSTNKRDAMNHITNLSYNNGKKVTPQCASGVIELHRKYYGNINNRGKK